MSPSVHSSFLAYDGSGIDGGLYTRVTGWAADAPDWLDRLVTVWSDLGLGLFAVLMLWGWWRARGAGPAVMARVLAAPAIVVLAYAVNSVFKSLIEENRPCRQIAGSFTLEACPGAGDWSFPSNHAVIAFAAAAALWFADRRLGWIAGVAAVLMAASRVWVGVHYPHDVAVGALVGVAVAVPVALLAGRAAPVVVRLRAGRLGPVLG
ncbi:MULTISPECIES: phosphatase PAP2 family protein [Kitasatospora]|uniref:Undecaprenyl-diphosphatase n=2 Tax=Kitasatospora TaxID=2063 RepID=A0ABT1IT10_9ACTN|nr:phosphatase PAP2 family protein [Kitasatospora paracochleata]MCP2308068.1 undecaprenyl-diphosphatase [Kitasatospora paracochleata]